MELGNHAEFVGAMTRSEMLSMFFINDASDTGTWILKGHAQSSAFWQWLCSWAVMISKPSDLDYPDDGFTLPELTYHEHIIKSSAESTGFFTDEVSGMNDRRHVRSETVEIRCKKAAEIINSTDDKWIAWCGLNTESAILTELIHDAIEITGSQTNEIKAKLMLDFAEGTIDRVVTKPKIAGRGMNWQICNNMVFVGMNDSWEDLYQAIRRIYRFGQKKPVNVHIIIEEREGAVLSNIKRKDIQAKEMMRQMIKYTQGTMKAELGQLHKSITDYNPTKTMEVPKWLKSEY